MTREPKRRVRFTMKPGWRKCLCVASVLLCASVVRTSGRAFTTESQGLHRVSQRLAHAPEPKQQINITVALDGSGQFKSVQEAIMSVPAGSPAKPVVIHIKPGIYKELIYIQHEK